MYIYVSGMYCAFLDNGATKNVDVHAFWSRAKENNKDLDNKLAKDLLIYPFICLRELVPTPLNQNKLLKVKHFQKTNLF